MLRSSFEAIGLQLELPDVNVPTFTEMTASSSLAALDALHDSASQLGPVRWCLIGSSMGSYLASRWAELHPERVHRLLLLSPAFNMPSVISGIMPSGSTLDTWKSAGLCALCIMAQPWPGQCDPYMWLAGEWEWPGPDKKPVPVKWQFIEDYLQHPLAPVVPCTTVILHGERDTLVPLEMVREYAAAHSQNVQLVVVEDDHRMVVSMPAILQHVSRCFDLPELPLADQPQTVVSQFDSEETG